MKIRKSKKWLIEVSDGTEDVEFAPDEQAARDNFNGRTLNRAWGRTIVKIFEDKRRKAS